MILGGIDGDTIQPRIERTVAAKSRQSAIGLNEGLLGDITDFVAVPNIAGDQIDNLGLITCKEQVKGRWKGRTPNTKLVFVESEQNLLGKILPIQITWTGPWSMQGRLLPQHAGQEIKLELPLISS